MANFQPHGIIRIGRVPWDNSYKHTMRFTSKTNQTTFMQGQMKQSLASESYTYVRMNNAIRVNFNAENLYTYNYCMYQNSNYGSKWFYAFIVEVNYINENVTELVLELDVMQTWWFDFNLKAGFVEREHVADDSIGAHLNPEPEMPFNLIAKNKWTDSDFQNTIAVVQTNATPYYSGDSVKANGSTAVNGGVYNGVVSGAAYYGFSTASAAYDEYELGGFLNGLNEGGGADSVSNIFQIPSAFVEGKHTGGGGTGGNSSDPYRGYRIDTNKPAGIKAHYTNLPTSLDNGYVPRNNKLFTYPYCFCRVEDNAGHHADWKYELWNTTPSGKQFVTTVPLDPDATAFVIPNGYDGEESNWEQALTFPCTAKCSWVYSSYQTWSAQNSLANTITGLVSTAALVIPAAKGASAAAKIIGGQRMMKGATKASEFIAGAKLRGAGRAAMKSATDNLGGLSIAGGAAGLSGLASDISRHSLIPDTVRGSASGNSLMATNHMNYNVKAMVIQEEFARIVDGFFDMYGYQVDAVKVPNISSRPNWNYIKMQNACHWGNVPADDMALINSIFDNGITFWHTSDVGNYSLANK